MSTDNVIVGGDVIPCNYCLRKFSSTKGLLSHLASNKNLELVCYNCNVVYKNNCAYQYHKMLENDMNANDKQEDDKSNVVDHKPTKQLAKNNIDNNKTSNAANKPENCVKNALHSTAEVKESKRQKVSKINHDITEEKKDAFNDQEEKLISILMDSKSKAKKCPICSNLFNDTVDLKLHGRSHGLAFLKYCQKRNLLSTSTLANAKKLL